MAKWIPTGDVLITMVGDYPTAECSKCHTPCVDLGNFCPYCGEKMEKIIVKTVFDNSVNIATIAKHMNKVNRKHGLAFILIAVNLYLTSKQINEQQKEINNLKAEIEEMKSKGE